MTVADEKSPSVYPIDLKADVSPGLWNDGELRNLLGRDTFGKPGDDDEVNRIDKPMSQAGDVWVLGDHRLLCGSSTEEANYVLACGGLKPFLMMTDPPYGVKFDTAWRANAGLAIVENIRGKIRNDDRADWRDAYVLFRGDVAYLWHAGIYSGIVDNDMRACQFETRAQIIWKKPVAPISRGAYHWGHEPCLYFVRKGATAKWCGDRKQSTVWEMASPGTKQDQGEDETEHGSQKPLEAMLRPILNHGQPGDVVYDPFVGSGTTIIAAERANRRCVAIELDPGYVDAIVQRWEKATGGKAQLAPGSPSLAGKAQPAPPAADDSPAHEGP